MTCLILWESVTAVLEGSFQNFNLTCQKKQGSLFITHRFMFGNAEMRVKR